MDAVTEAIATSADWTSIPVSVTAALLFIYLKFDHFAAAVKLLWTHYVNSKYQRDARVLELLKETIDSVSRELDQIQEDLRQIKALQADEYKRELIELLKAEKNIKHD